MNGRWGREEQAHRFYRELGYKVTGYCIQQTEDNLGQAGKGTGTVAGKGWQVMKSLPD